MNDLLIVLYDFILKMDDVLSEQIQSALKMEDLSDDERKILNFCLSLLFLQLGAIIEKVRRKNLVSPQNL